MKVVLFCHSIRSCWNHGNAHFLRGVVRELIALGHAVTVYEPVDGWSRQNAVRDGGESILQEASGLVPGLAIRCYDPLSFDAAEATDGADLVLVHEWSEPEVVAALGRERAQVGDFTLLFHDTHHRAATAPHELGRFDLQHYDGVLAFGEVLREIYISRGWGRRAFVWHEAADTALFKPIFGETKDTDLVWIGNWGDDERTAELFSYLIHPIERLQLTAQIYGVRYPQEAQQALAQRGIAYKGWLPNHRVPQAFARARVTVHVPRGPYVKALPGIPTIRMFEALACGIPLVSAPWSDVEGLFPSGAYQRASNEDDMCEALQRILSDPELASDLVQTGLQAIRSRHTCAHRVRELLDIVHSLRAPRVPRSSRPRMDQQVLAS